jgi:hypothetical protein
MLHWKVKYYNGTTVLDQITSLECSWEDLPTENVIEMEISNGDKLHTLGGMDNYWVSGSYYGLFNNTGSLAEEEENRRKELGHQEWKYIGESFVTYKWDDTHIKLKEQIQLDGVHILKGVMVSDEHAKVFGLI